MLHWSYWIVLPNGWTSTIHDTIIYVEEHKKLKTVLFLK